MKRYFSRIVIGCLCALLLVTSTANKSESQPPVALLNPYVVGGLLVAGLALGMASDFYANKDTAIPQIRQTCAENGQIYREAWQAIETTNSLGQSYLVGRANALAGKALDLYNQMKNNYGAQSQATKDLLDNYPPTSGSGCDGCYWTEPSTGDKYVMTKAPTTYDGSQVLPINPPPQTQYGYYAGVLTSIRTYSFLTTEGCAPGTAVYNHKLWWTVPYDPADPLPPNGQDGDACPFAEGVGSYGLAIPVDVGKDIDREISQSPPGIWNPSEPGDITEDGTVIPEPAPVDIPADTPDPAIDNELLRGIYNNTLATAKTTVKVRDAVVDVKGQIIALPGAIVPPIVGAIEALPGQLVPGITDPIVAKLDEVKNAIPPPITSITVEGSTPTLPNNNEYDPSVTSPTELSLATTILDFIQNGLPFTSMLNDIAISLSNPVSHYDFELYDHQFSFDLTPYEGHLRAFGAFLYIMTVITSFVLVVRK